MDLFNQIRKKLVIFVQFNGFNISQKPKIKSSIVFCTKDKFKFGAKSISDNFTCPFHFTYWYFRSLKRFWDCDFNYTLAPRRGRGVYCFTSVRPSVQDIFCRIFLSNYWWQKSDIWSQASYRYPISWEAVLDPSDSYFLFADFVDFYTHLTYICICTFFVAFF